MSVFQRGDIFYFRFQHQGKEIWRAVGPNKLQAQRAEEKFKRALTDRKFHLAPVRRRVAEYFALWLETYARVHCKPSTVESYVCGWERYLKPRLGERDLADVSREELRHLVHALRTDAHLSIRSTQAYLAPLSGMFSQAVEDGLLPANPCARLFFLSKKALAPGQGRQADFLTRDELRQLLRTVYARFPADYALVLLLARTGLRIGEALALQWGDVDTTTRALYVRRTFDRSNTRLTTPKGKRYRQVDLSSHLTQVLRECKAARQDTTNPWVFLSASGRPKDKDNWRNRTWGKILEAAGLRRIRIHDLRHTFASLLLQQGESLVYVKDQLGHSSIKITVDIYGHLVPHANKAAVDKLDDEAQGPPG
jgi:integrase